jgi:hypothetical protein
VRVSGSKLVLIVLAALILALGVVAFLVLSEGPQAADTAAVEDEHDGARRGDGRLSGRADDGEPRAEVQPRSERRERRRFRSEQQRRKLIAAIELARAARMQGRLPGDDRAASRGELSKESIRDAVQAVIEDVKTCYDEQLRLSPELGGKLIVEFTINAEEGVGGVVDSVEIGDGSDEQMRQAADLAECIVDTIYTLELPEPEGGGTVDVSYPLVMSPGPRPAS